MQQYKDQLYIFCYSDKCQYEKIWTPTTKVMRGMVLDREGVVVGQCLPKFFNLNEVEETKVENLPALNCEIFQKLDGSYISSWFNPYEQVWQHSSKCSFDNEYIDAAYTFLSRERMSKCLPDYVSLVSEIRFDTDPMRRVTTCPPGLYLITAYDKRDGSELPRQRLRQLAQNLGVGIVETFGRDLQDKLVSFPQETDTEGYVVRFSNGFRVKLKTPWYLQLNRALDAVSTPSEARKTVKQYLDFYEGSMEWILQFPDELWVELEEIVKSLRQEYADRVSYIDKIFEEKYIDDSRAGCKAFALSVKELSLADQAALFSRLRGLDYKKLIWEKL